MELDDTKYWEMTTHPKGKRWTERQILIFKARSKDHANELGDRHLQTVTEARDGYGLQSELREKIIVEVDRQKYENYPKDVGLNEQTLDWMMGVTTR